ncbi:hypothetical protein POTOM_055935 [Populus tomentosa]|uniref:Uncharacterized protein n=1 Tax=Populus tomentosa TaxID=118781 RepID=A0A8X8C5N2_POPTO|nr:hypothetical protein POTOM_055935 [Populus tomentosa]
MNAKHKEEEIWYFDSGCSHHIIGDCLRFETLDEEFSSHVELGDNKRVEIKGRGDVAIHTNKDRSIWCISFEVVYGFPPHTPLDLKYSLALPLRPSSFQVTTKLGTNVYVIGLPSDFGTSPVFNIKVITEFKGDTEALHQQDFCFITNDDPMLWYFCDEIDKGESDQVGASYQNQGQSSNESIPDKQASNGPGRSEEAVHVKFTYSVVVGNYTTKLEIHGRMGIICHAILNNRDHVKAVHLQHYMFQALIRLVQRERAGKLTLNDLRQYLRLPIEYAARRLHFCSTVVKKYGMNRWLHR